jgi:hypothetical protein
MKLNKWTLGLAAVGAVSLASTVTAKADGNTQVTPVQTALQGIVLSGYVDTSIEYGLYPASSEYANSPVGGVPFRGQGTDKQNGFNLNVIQLNLEKALDEAEYASGFKISMLFGPDAVGYNTSFNGTSGSDFAIKQAYVNLRYPIGNGLEVKLGVFDTIIGYEVFEAGNNPNFTRSWGYALEPTEHTGALWSYRFSDLISANLGIADTSYGGINARRSLSSGNNYPNDYQNFTSKTIMGSVALTAPDSMGFLKGSTLYAGFVDGWGAGYGNGGSTANSNGQTTMNIYAGAVINTPVAGLTAGIAYDYLHGNGQFYDTTGTDLGSTPTVNNFGFYASYKATEKLSLHGRYEYGWWNSDGSTGCYYGLTGTIQYDLFANVISRLEVRYEVADDGFNPGSISVGQQYSTSCGAGLYANIIYKF